ncbi:MAG: hypothetical protein WCF33_02895 [Pseudonocardiaceae bacterium]
MSIGVAYAAEHKLIMIGWGRPGSSLTDQASLGVLAASVPRDVVDAAVAARGALDAAGVTLFVALGHTTVPQARRLR